MIKSRRMIAANIRIGLHWPCIKGSVPGFFFSKVARCYRCRKNYITCILMSTYGLLHCLHNDDFESYDSWKTISLYIACNEQDWDGMESQWNRLSISVQFKFMLRGIAGIYTRVDTRSFSCWSVVEQLTPRMAARMAADTETVCFAIIEGPSYLRLIVFAVKWQK
jgi:hypothetical protein